MFNWSHLFEAYLLGVITGLSVLEIVRIFKRSKR